MKENKYTISEAARLLSVENHVLRYWEEELELKIPRNELGHRYYREEEIQLLHCIKELKNKGFQLKAVKEVLPDLEQKKLIDIHKLLTTQEELENHINELREEAESIIADANEQAQKIIDDADEQVKRAAKEAKDNGYEEGLAQADAEYSLRKDELEKEYESRKKQLEQEYTEKRNKIEPELIDVLTDVYNKVILSIADEDKEVLVHLINGVLSDAEKSDEFVIKCSPQDYSYISENQGKIFCNMSKDITLDITTDETLGKNDCIIETDGAVFDCSLDKELANLTKKIKMLSCLD